MWLPKVKQKASRGDGSQTGRRESRPCAQLPALGSLWGLTLSLPSPRPVGTDVTTDHMVLAVREGGLEEERDLSKVLRNEQELVGNWGGGPREGTRLE